MIASRLVRFHFVSVISMLTGFVSALPAQNCPDASVLTRGLTGPIVTVRYLADDALQGRLAGSPGERCAGDFIAARFREFGLQPRGTNQDIFKPCRSHPCLIHTPRAPVETSSRFCPAVPRVFVTSGSSSARITIISGAVI